MVERRTRTIARTRLLGFGPLGWALLGVFVALLAWAWITPDPRYQVFVWIYETFGIQVLLWFLIWIVLSGVLLIQYYAFNPLFATTLMIGAFISSRYASPWRMAVCFACALLMPCVFYPSLRYGDLHLSDSGLVEILRILNPQEYQAVTGVIATNVMASVLFWIIFRSRLLALAALSVTPLAIFDQHLFRGNLIRIPTTPGEFMTLSANVGLAHLIFAGITMAWAFRVRSTIPPFDGGCPHCGYDTSNLPEPRCPECGCDLSRPPVPGASRAPEPRVPEP